MGNESAQHRLLPNGPDGPDYTDDDDLELSQNELSGRQKTGSRRFAKSCFLVTIWVISCIASFFGGTRMPMRNVSLDAKCAAHTTQWCK